MERLCKRANTNWFTCGSTNAGDRSSFRPISRVRPGLSCAAAMRTMRTHSKSRRIAWVDGEPRLREGISREILRAGNLRLLATDDVGSLGLLDHLLRALRIDATATLGQPIGQAAQLR